MGCVASASRVDGEPQSSYSTNSSPPRKAETRPGPKVQAAVLPLKDLELRGSLDESPHSEDGFSTQRSPGHYRIKSEGVQLSLAPIQSLSRDVSLVTSCYILLEPWTSMRKRPGAGKRQAAIPEDGEQNGGLPAAIGSMPSTSDNSSTTVAHDSSLASTVSPLGRVTGPETPSPATTTLNTPQSSAAPPGVSFYVQSISIELAQTKYYSTGAASRPPQEPRTKGEPHGRQRR